MPLQKMTEGILVNEKGIPYSLAGGKIVNMGTGAEISFFTGRNGKFLNIDLRDKLKEERNNLGEIVVR